jgi:hypothetical protein
VRADGRAGGEQFFQHDQAFQRVAGVAERRGPRHAEEAASPSAALKASSPWAQQLITGVKGVTARKARISARTVAAWGRWMLASNTLATWRRRRGRASWRQGENDGVCDGERPEAFGGAVAVLTMDAPESLNAIGTVADCDDFVGALEAVQATQACARRC